MSSYLKIYAITKDPVVREKHLLVSFTRSNPVYKAIYDNMNVPFDDGDGNNFVPLTSANLGEIARDIDETITKTRKMIDEMEKHCGPDLEMINEIIEAKEYLEENIETKGKIALLMEMANDMENGYCYFDRLVCSIS